MNLLVDEQHPLCDVIKAVFDEVNVDDESDSFYIKEIVSITKTDHVLYNMRHHNDNPCYRLQVVFNSGDKPEQIVVAYNPKSKCLSDIEFEQVLTNSN